MNFLVEPSGWVWKASLSAAVLVVLAVLVLACFRNVLPPWARYGIWVLVFVRLMLPVVPQARFSVWNLQRHDEKSGVPIMLAPSAGYQPAIQQINILRHEKVRVLPTIWIAGAFVWLGIAIAKHQRLARWMRRQEACADARIASLLDQARRAFGLRTKITVICNERFEVPAVFGVFRPKLLIPAAWATAADDEELYAILLHEVAHVKCRDTLMNCLCIFLRSLHWFNPAIWYSFRRLRRERELFCDALVLARLRPAQRSAYGNTLIKIAAQLSGAPTPTNLVPVLQHKPEIHRRIHMIAKYKSTPWIISAVVALVLVVIAGLTFTRAADKPTTPPTAAPGDKDKVKPLEVLELEIDRTQARIQQLQEEADKCHARLSSQSIDAIVSPGPSQVVQKMQAQQMEAKAEFDRLAGLYEYLSKLSRADLRRSISTASPDAQLTELMKQQDMAEQKLADLIEALTPEHPDVKRITRVLAQINKQKEDRIDGIMKGLEARRDAERASLDGMEKALLQARQHHFENVRQSRPYQELLKQLQAQEEILQRLRARMTEERINRVIEESKGK